MEGEKNTIMGHNLHFVWLCNKQMMLDKLDCFDDLISGEGRNGGNAASGLLRNHLRQWLIGSVKINQR